MVSGMYFDDWWPESGGFPDPFPHMADDMGLTAAEQMAISKSYVVFYKFNRFDRKRARNQRASPTKKNPRKTQGKGEGKKENNIAADCAQRSGALCFVACLAAAPADACTCVDVG